ncbi:MAG: hypothetical protein PHP22_09070 [Oscillospiraceae bacterium]|nr:hypothetical protein [Oscillospiraceae bacterium]
MKILELQRSHRHPASCFNFSQELRVIDVPTDGAAKWVVDRWNEDHVDSVFSLPEVFGGLLSAGSRALFERYLAANPSGGLADWVRMLV